MIPKGRVKASIRIQGIRSLTREDLPLLEGRRDGSVSRVKKFRASHHYVALLYAQGHTTAEVMALTGYSYLRLSTLSGTPAFQDLIESKRKVIETMAAEDQFTKNLKEIALKGQRHVIDQFDEYDENDELMPTKTALSAASDALDRLGIGRHSTSTVAHVNYADELERRVRHEKTMKTVDAVTPIPSQVSASTPGPEASSARAVFKRRI